MTYNPHFELFYQVLEIIAQTAEKSNDEIMGGDSLEILKKLYEFKGSAVSEVTIPASPFPVVYKMPSQSELTINSTGYFCPTLFSALPLDTIYQLLCCILLERSIIFQSEDMHILTSSM